jgi:hypothetical protein
MSKEQKPLQPQKANRVQDGVIAHPTLQGENQAQAGEHESEAEVQGPSGDGLAAALGALLPEPAPADGSSDPFAIAATSTIEATPLPPRAALWADLTFWQAPWWAEGGRRADHWRRHVDPLAEVLQAADTLDEAEFSSLCQIAAFRSRLLANGDFVDALLKKRSPTEALSLRLLLATGVRANEAPMTTLFGLLSQSDPQAVQAALNMVRLDPEVALQVATHRGVLAAIRQEDPELAATIDAQSHRSLTGNAPSDASDSTTPSDGWMSAAEERIERLVTDLKAGTKTGGTYTDPGPALLSILVRAQAQLTQHAQALSDNPGQVVARVRMAMVEAGDRFASSQSVLAVLDQVQDLGTQRRVAQLLGRERDTVGEAASTSEAVSPEDREHTAALGVLLAEAVGRNSQTEAQAVADVFRDLWQRLDRDADNPDQLLSTLQTILVVAYANIGGNLTFGLSNLEDGDDIARRIGFDSLAIAQKSDDDTRTDRVIQAEYDLEFRLAALFRRLTAGEESLALRITRPGPDGLLVPAQVLAPDNRTGFIDSRYYQAFGIHLADHVGNAPISQGGRDKLRQALSLRSAPEVCTGDESQSDLGAMSMLTPEFYEVSGTPIEGCSPDRPPMIRVQTAVQAHVDHLHHIVERLMMEANPELIVVGDPQKELTQYLATLATTGGRARVLSAFEDNAGVGVQFYLESLSADGHMDERTMASVRRLLDHDTTVHPVAAELRGEADAGTWNEVLATVNDPSFASARSAVLADGETLAHLRERAPNSDGWDLFYRSATGELSDAELINRHDGFLSDSAERVPLSGLTKTAAEWASGMMGRDTDWVEQQLAEPGQLEYFADNPYQWALSGDKSDRFETDSDRLLGLRDQGLEGDALETQQAIRVTDPDVQHRLQTSQGDGDGRYLAEMNLVGRGNQGKAVEAATHAWGQLSDARAAIAAMSDGERQRALADPIFLAQIDMVTENNLVAREQLTDLLQNGPDGAWKDALHDSEGDGIDTHILWWREEPWKATEALSKLSMAELSDIASNPTLADRFRDATEQHPAALAEVERLFEAATSDTSDAPGLAQFTALHCSRLVVALYSGEDKDVATSLMLFAAALQSQLDPATGYPAQPGWTFDGLRDAMYPPLAAAADDRYNGVVIWNWAAKALYMDLFDKAVRGEASMDSRILARMGGDDAEVLTGIVKAASDQTIATEWTSLTRPTRGGAPSLQSVYASYQSAKSAAEAAPNNGRHTQVLEDATIALQYARVDLSDTALSIDVMSRQAWGGGHHDDLESMSPAAWETARTQVRKRIAALPAALVHGIVGVDPADAHLVWSAQMRSGTVVSEMVDKANTSLAETSFIFEDLSGSDNDAALHYAVFAQQHADMPGERSEADLKRLTALASQVQGSIAEYDKARKAAADLASFAATLLVTAVTAAVTGPGAAPAVAHLISLGSSAISGLATVAIRESVQGSRYDAQEGLRTLAFDLVKDTVTAGTGAVWSELATAKAFSQIPMGRIPRFLHTTQKSAEKTFGKPATAIAMAGAAVPWQGIQDASWATVEESLAGRGWQAGIDSGLLVLEAKLQSLPEDTILAILSETADQLGKAAVADDEQTSAPGARGLGAELDPTVVDSQKAAQQTLAELIQAKLSGAGDAMVDKTIESLVSGGSGLLFTETFEMLRTGEHALTDDDVMGVLGSSLKSVAQTGSRETGAAVSSARQTARSQGRMVTLERLMSEAGTSRTTDRHDATFVKWASESTVDLSGPDALTTARQRFRTDVTERVQGQLELQRIALDSPHFDAYEQWVFEDPSKALSRAQQVSMAQFTERRGLATAALASQRESAGFRQLTPFERRWFDHASSTPTGLADLTQDDGGLSIDLADPERRAEFQKGVAKVSSLLGQQWVRRWAEDMGGDRGTFAREHVEVVARDLGAVPGDDARGYALIAQRVDRHRAMMARMSRASGE